MQHKRDTWTRVRRMAGALTACALLASGDVMAQATPRPPERLTYQGYLTGADGVALGNAATKNYDVIFRIFDSEAANATPLWGEQQTVTVDKGYFSVLLGEGAAVTGAPNAGVTLSSLFAGATASDRWVGMTVKEIGAGGTDVEILPRVRLMTSPYAFLASRALSATKIIQDNAAGSDLLTGSGSTLTLNGALAVTGKNTIEFGSDVTPKDGANGKIGYAAFTQDTLDVVGAGTNAAARKIKFWNEGGATFTGPINAHSLNIPKDNFLDLGVGYTKGTWNGKIRVRTDDGARAFSLDIYGAGPNDSNRTISLDSDNVYGGKRLGVGTFPHPAFPLMVSSVENYSAIFAGYCQSPAFLVHSDARIKDVVGRSAATEDMELIRRISVTSYRMKDRTPDDSRQFKGVLAQELQKVLPDAVTASVNVVPDILQEALVVEQTGPGNTTLVRVAKPHGLHPGERVRMDSDGRLRDVVVGAVPDETSFSFAGDGSVPRKVRVIGREVKDFLAVDYPQIFMTAVSALQQVDRRVQDLEKREARMEELERKAARVDAMDRDLAELKKLVAALATVGGKDKPSAASSNPASGAATVAVAK